MIFTEQKGCLNFLKISNTLEQFKKLPVPAQRRLYRVVVDQTNKRIHAITLQADSRTTYCHLFGVTNAANIQESLEVSLKHDRVAIMECTYLNYKFNE